MRDITFDIMKGIGIIAMIIGHCNIQPSLDHFIFMWHMPLFFIVSGYFFKLKENKAMIKTSFKSLIIPYIITCSIIIIITQVISIFSSEVTVSYLKGALTGSGSSDNPVFFSGKHSIGAIWFLLALFWSRCLYNLLKGRFSTIYEWIIIIIISVLSGLLGRYVYLPFDILQGASALIFIHIGHFIREKNICNVLKNNVLYFSVIFLLIIPLGFLIRRTAIVVCDYSNNWPLMVVVALASTGLVYLLSDSIKTSILGRVLSIVGRISLLVLCVHLLDINFLTGGRFFDEIDILSLSSVLGISIHLIIAIAGAYLLSKLSFMKTIFHLS